MNTKYLLIGIVAGILVATVTGITFASNQAAAQMGAMQHGQGTMGPGMMATTGQWQTNQGPFSATGGSVVNNVRVTGVAVTGDSEVTVSLRYMGTGRAPSVVVIANTNPTAIMSAMHGGMGGMMQGGMGGMMSGGMMGGMQGMGMMGSGSAAGNVPAWNSTQWQQWHEQMSLQLGQIDSSQWQQWQDWHTQMMGNPQLMGPAMMGSGMGPALNLATVAPQSAPTMIGSDAIDAGWRNGTFKVSLEGDGSAFDSSQVMVMVFPLTG
jgi:hypothetical protein